MMERISYIDSIKGLAIFLMVMGHALFCCLEGTGVDIAHVVPEAPSNLLYAAGLGNFIYSFHMGLFFFISGFLTYKDRFDYKHLLISRSKRLLVPYIVLLLLGQYYWFLFSLWQISLVASLLIGVLGLMKKRSPLLDLIFVIGSFFALDLFFNLPLFAFDKPDLRYGMYFYMPFCFGMLVRKYKCIEDYIHSNPNVPLLCYLALFLMTYFTWPSWKGFSPTTLSTLFLSTAASLFIFDWFKSGINRYLDKGLSYIGSKTMQIYILHVFFLPHFSQLGEYWINTDCGSCLMTQIVYSMVCSSIVIIIALLVSSVMERSILIRNVFFGQ